MKNPWAAENYRSKNCHVTVNEQLTLREQLTTASGEKSAIGALKIEREHKILFRSLGKQKKLENVV